MPCNLHDMQLHVKQDIAHCSLAAATVLAQNATMDIAKHRKQRGLTQKDLGDMLGVDPATVQRAETMHSSAKLATYLKYASALGVSLADLFRSEDGEGPLPAEYAPPDFPVVPVYDVQASAGHGALVDVEAEVHTLAFPPSYLKRLTSSSPANLAIISVKGESMEPTLLDDDIVLLDRSKTNLSYDGLFVLRFDDALHVKRVGRSARRGHVTIISDNSQLYPPMEADRGEIEAVGKVLWYGRRV